eukprot:g711.t1
MVDRPPSVEYVRDTSKDDRIHRLLATNEQQRVEHDKEKQQLEAEKEQLLAEKERENARLARLRAELAEKQAELFEAEEERQRREDAFGRNSLLLREARDSSRATTA